MQNRRGIERDEVSRPFCLFRQNARLPSVDFPAWREYNKEKVGEVYHGNLCDILRRGI